MTKMQLILIFGTLLMTGLLTGVAIRYSRYAGLMDEPGGRRSHKSRVPRGGGIAMIICLIAALLICRQYGWIKLPLLFTWMVPLLLAGAVGWWDDHTPLSVKLRIFIQLLAVMSALAGFYPLFDISIGTSLMMLIIALWFLNLFNFMDGSHGLAAGQGIFSGAVFAWLLTTAGHADGALVALLITAVCLGFLPWNFPRPRVFMGDVASGSLGLALAILAGWSYLSGSLSAAMIILVLSTFIIDATLTLLNRMYRRQQWYTAHTEHAYQRLIALGCGHTETFLLYQSVNVVVVLPGVVWMRYFEGFQWTITGTIMIAQTLAWFWVYRRSLLTQTIEKT